jgi:hypothetical protein
MAAARKTSKRTASTSKPRGTARGQAATKSVSPGIFAAALARIAALEAQVAQLSTALQVTGRDVALAAGGTLVLRAGALAVEGAGTVQIAGSRVDVAAGMASFDVGLLKVSGVVHCDTLQTTTVIASTYTPGAGNVL